MIIMNRVDLLGEYRNRLATNLLGAAVVAVVSGLGLWNIVRLFL
jgi:Mn2+/Fe2+ NRAMP family transporter